MHITEAAVRAILEPHEARIAGVIHRAWQATRAQMSTDPFEFKRTVATVMHDRMMRELRAEYFADRDVDLIQEHETIRLLIGRKLLVRVKKMDEAGATNAYPTQTAMSFVDPAKPVMLPFDPHQLPELHCVDMGYVLNQWGTAISYTLVAARMKDAVVWSYAFGRTAAMADATLIPAAPAPTSPVNIITVPADGERKSVDDKDGKSKA